MTTEGRRAYALLLGPFNGPKWPESRASPELDAKWPRRALCTVSRQPLI